MSLIPLMSATTAMLWYVKRLASWTSSHKPTTWTYKLLVVEGGCGKKTHFWLVTPRNLTVWLDDWMTTFLFGRYIFRGYVKLQVGNEFDTLPFHSGYPTGWCENLTDFFSSGIIKGRKLWTLRFRSGTDGKEFFFQAVEIPGLGLCCWSCRLQRFQWLFALGCNKKILHVCALVVVIGFCLWNRDYWLYFFFWTTYQNTILNYGG